MITSDKKQQARHLFLTQLKTQREIALEVGVSERTVYTWIHEHKWDRLRQVAYEAPVTISENLCSQLIEMQNAIARREPGCRYPDLKEAEVMRKLVLSIETMKKYPSLSQNMQMMETFRNYVRPLNKQFAKQLAHYADRFLSEKSDCGFAPYQLEFGMTNVAPVASYYDELDGDEPCDTAQPPEEHIPCANMDECRHPGSCNYPKCKYETFPGDDPQNDACKNPKNIPLSAHSISRSSDNTSTSLHSTSRSFGEGWGEAAETGSIPAISPIENSGNGQFPKPQFSTL